MFLISPDRSRAVLQCEGPDCTATISLNCQDLDQAQIRQKIQLQAWQMGWHIIQTTIGHFCPSCARPKTSSTTNPSLAAPSPVGCALAESS